VVGDLITPGTCETVVQAAVQKLGGLTTLVNCAGVLQGAAFGTPACNLVRGGGRPCVCGGGRRGGGSVGTDLI
jgi:hypothetical protein